MCCNMRIPSCSALLAWQQSANMFSFSYGLLFQRIPPLLPLRLVCRVSCIIAGLIPKILDPQALQFEPSYSLLAVLHQDGTPERCLFI